MSNPTNMVATQEELSLEELTFADQVNKVVNTMSKDEKGEWVLPNGEKLSEELKVAAIAEKRYRDTQASYTKANQKLKAIEAERSALMQKALGSIELQLTAEQAEELDDLKFSDPEAWRKKMNKYETAAVEQRKKELDDEIKNISTSSLDEQEKERRKDVLDTFLKENEGFELNDTIINNDIPPRIVNKLANGEITFEDFLQECFVYLNTGKTVAQTERPLGQPNLNKVGGGSKPDDNAVKEDIIKSYKTETF